METLTDMNQETIDGLKDLVHINVDSAEGFTLTAEKTNVSALAELFTTLAQDRQRFAEELKRVVEYNAASVEKRGTWKGKIHRWWVDARGTIEGGDAYAILAEAERGEDAIKELYEETLKETAGSPVNAMLTEQYRLVKRGHDTVRDLRDAAKR